MLEGCLTMNRANATATVAASLLALAMGVVLGAGEAEPEEIDPARAKLPKELPAKYLGEKLVVEFYTGTLEDYAVKDHRAAQDRVAGEIRRAIADAKLTVVEAIRDSRDYSGTSGLNYLAQSLLLDFGAARPDDAIQGLPHRRAALLLKDGHYVRDVPEGKEAVRKAPCVILARVGAVHAEARFRELACLSVERVPPPHPALSGPGHLRFTPREGYTLLHVLLATKGQLGR